MKPKRKVSDDVKKLASLNKKRYESETSESDIPPAAPKSLEAKISNFKIRTISSIIMVGGFVLFLSAGHFYCCLLVLLINICIFKEIISLKRNSQRESKLPYFYIINWYFFGATELVVGFMFISHKMIMSPTLKRLFQYNYLIMFGLFVFGIVLFVLSLRKGQYKYQFSMFAWTILTCALVVSQSSTVILNIYEGIIWFILPASMVIINDSSAYCFGILFGKTPLIEISPNKTLEGFIGGLISTILISFYVIPKQLCRFLSNFEYFLCPQDIISLTPFVSHSCNNSDLLQSSLRSVFGIQFYLSNLEISSIVLATFAGFIAPFGGFFASGVKRAFKIKDFGDSIPGHGGMTDRMDCQILMGMFTCVWTHTMLASYDSSIQQILLQISMLSYSDQLALLAELKAKLAIVI